MNIIHAADLHLDSPLRGLSSYDGAPVDRLRGATREAFRRLVELCIQQNAELLLLAGDIWDGQWRDFGTGLFLLQQLGRLREVGTQVVLVHGNHDAQNQFTSAVAWPDHVRVLSTQGPETLRLESLGIAVHGQSYARHDVNENLAATYPRPLPGLLNIGLLHTNVDGGTEHGNYAPCSTSQLVDHGYDYWALGHIHKRAVLHKEPWIVYPGNLQGRHAKETGPKGCTLVQVQGGRIQQLTHTPLDVVRWRRLTVQVDPDDTQSDVVDKAQQLAHEAVSDADGRLIAARVDVVGTLDAHQDLLSRRALLRQQVIEATASLGEGLWIEKVHVGTRPPPTPWSDPHGLRGSVRSALQELRESPEGLSALTDPLTPLLKKLKPFDMEGSFNDPDQQRQLLDRVEALLLSGLSKDGS